MGFSDCCIHEINIIEMCTTILKRVISEGTVLFLWVNDVLSPRTRVCERAHMVAVHAGGSTSARVRGTARHCTHYYCSFNFLELGLSSLPSFVSHQLINRSFLPSFFLSFFAFFPINRTLGSLPTVKRFESQTLRQAPLFYHLYWALF